MLLAVSSGLLVACASGASGAEETVVPTTRPSTTTSSTTTSSTTTTSTSTTTTTTLPPVQVTGVFPDVVEAAKLGPLPDGLDINNSVIGKPVVYDDGCHAGVGAVVPAPCEYGMLTSDTVIVLVGDSHAAQWFSAIDIAAWQNDWKVVTMTKSSCPAVDVSTYRRTDGDTGDQIPYPECDRFRHNSWETIRELHPDLVIFPLLTRYKQINGSGFGNWKTGLATSISAIAQEGTKVLIIGEAPKTSGVDVPACLRSHRNDISECANTRAEAEYPEKIFSILEVAIEHRATFVNPVDWVCDTEVCPVVIGGNVVYRDSNHLNDAFVRYRAPQVAEAIRLALEGDDAI